MLGLKRIKDAFLMILREHSISTSSVFLSMLLYAITTDGFDKYESAEKVINLIATFLVVFAVGALVCETYRLYKKTNDGDYDFKNKKYIVANASVMAVSAVLGFFSGVSLAYDSKDVSKVIGLNELSVRLIYEYAIRITFCFVVAAICATLYFFYKKSKCSFEIYTAKAFCGLLKAELVYAVITIGLFLIVAAFNALLFELDYSVYERLWIFLLGLVQFPCILVGLSKTDGEISKFGKVMLTIVLPGLLAIAFLIVYIYIIKIIVTLKFPSNQVFGILTAMFAFGVFIWTMAQGICEENTKKIFRIMPLIFIPFIILQIISMSIRISGYGLTLARYAGIAVVVFEIGYFVLYFIGIAKKKEVIYLALPLIAVIVVISYLAPGINAYSSVIASQKGRIVKYFNNKDKAGKRTVKEASEAYSTLKYFCGATGEIYIKNHYSDEQLRELEKAARVIEESENTLKYIVVERAEDAHYTFSVPYTDFYNVQINYDREDDGIDLKTLELEIVSDEDEVVDTININDIVSDIMTLYKAGADDDELNRVLDKNIQLENGGELVISWLSIDLSDDGKTIDNVYADGYVFK